MRLLLPSALAERLGNELRTAGHREIGGVLVGEHVEGETFRLVDLSVQRDGGSESHFVRDVAQSRAFLDGFFERVNRDYARFNYIGEWHSHPLFAPVPSGQDRVTMHDIVQDPAVGVNFAVLMIVKLTRKSALTMSVTAFRAGGPSSQVDFDVEGEGIVKRSWLARFIDFFR